MIIPVEIYEAAIRLYLASQCRTLEVVFLSVEGGDPSEELLSRLSGATPPVRKGSQKGPEARAAVMQIKEAQQDGPEQFKVHGRVVSVLGSWNSWIYVGVKDGSWAAIGQFGRGHPSEEGLRLRYGNRRFEKNIEGPK